LLQVARENVMTRARRARLDPCCSLRPDESFAPPVPDPQWRRRLTLANFDTYSLPRLRNIPEIKRIRSLPLSRAAFTV
jgi:hypothetical protein